MVSRNLGITEKELGITDNIKQSMPTMSHAQREVWIIKLVNQGATLVLMGALFNLTRQRVKQIVDKLVAEKKLTNTTAQRKRDILKNREITHKTNAHINKYGIPLPDKDPVLIMCKKKIVQSRKSAKSKGIPHTLKLADIYPPPTTCPILGIPITLHVGGWSDNSLSIDRIIPSLGYTPDNIVVCSFRANRIKNDATINELEQITNYYKKLIPANLT